MSKNNTIRKSDKKFIRTEKARIRRDFLDVKKQEEMINTLYQRFVRTQKSAAVKTEMPKEKPVKEAKVEKVKTPAVAKALVGKEKPKVKKVATKAK